MKILFATYRKAQHFLDSLHIDDDDAAFLAVDTKAEYEDKEPVILEIGYPGLPNRILIRVTATETPAGRGDDDGKKWFRIADGEEFQRDFLIAVASGRAQASLQRRHRRFPVRMAAQIKVAGETHGDAETADMAAGGVALKTSEPLPDGTRVTVALDPGDGSQALEIEGTVVWNRQDDDNVEVGIEFDKSGGGESLKRLRQMIRGVKLSGETFE
jgi:hypothetical protein